MKISSLVENFACLKNPLQVAMKLVFAPNGVMTIVDRRTGVSLQAAVHSFRMFKETWYRHEYDAPGCPLRRNDAVIDIGANQGFFSCYAASKGARVHAFEPFPDSYKRLRKNIDRNGFSSVVTALPVAVAADSGRATMRCSNYLGGGANTIVEAHAQALKKEHVAEYTKTIDIETISMDSALATIPGRIRLCKMDCEGSEFDLIRGISDPSRIDALAIEFHPGAYSLREMVSVMAGWGTHQLSFARTAYVLYAVRTEVMAERCNDIDLGLLPFQPTEPVEESVSAER